MIKLMSLDSVEFAHEIKKVELGKVFECELTNAVAKNAAILFYYLKYKDVKSIKILKGGESLDIICYKQFSKYIRQHYFELVNDINIIFEKFSIAELELLLKERILLNYCSENGIELEWNKQILDNEKKKIEEHKELERYDTFRKLVKFQEENPYSNFNFPTEQGASRFVYYFHMYDDKQKEKVLALVKDLGLESYKKLIDLIKTNKINDEIFYYALGFVYKDDKLYRVTLYTKFDIKQINRGVDVFLKDKHNLDIEKPYKYIWYYAIDFYSDSREEIKIYEEPYQFTEKINNTHIFKILKNKMCVKVTKYSNNKVVGYKYEFEVRHFKKLEKKYLIEKGIFKENSKVFALYIKDNELVKTISYMI